MGKRKLLLGIILGAFTGGLATLCDREARAYTKHKMNSVKGQSKYYAKNPSNAVKDLKESFNTFNQKFAAGADSTLNALEQVEETLDKFTSKDKQ